MIEDSSPGIASAVAAGMRVLHYAGGAHLRGTDPMALPQGVGAFDNWGSFSQLLREMQDKAATP